MYGIISINKPKGLTSHDCVTALRRITGVKRIGHTGTLDPMATGVLPLCIGRATRITEYLDGDYKTYFCTVKLGEETDTCDVEGKVMRRGSVRGITEGDIKKALMSFEGRISQVPPKYSALKVNGRKLYQYARAGEEVEIKPREVFIKEMRVSGMRIGEEYAEADFEAICSKGTYMRSICRDIGEKLGCYGTMSALHRCASGIFKAGDALRLKNWRDYPKEAPDIEKYGFTLADIETKILPVDFPLEFMKRIDLSGEEARDFANGRLIDRQVEDEYHRVYANDIFLGVGKQSEGRKLKADKVFNNEGF